MKLNLGSGNVRLRDGYTTLDANPAHAPDIVAVAPPLPLPDESCETILASHFFEHVRELPELMAECWRVLTDGGTLEIICPYAFSHGGVQDPTHVRFIVPETWAYFTPHMAYLGYGYETRFRMREVANDGQEVRVLLVKDASATTCERCPFCP